MNKHAKRVEKAKEMRDYAEKANKKKIILTSINDNKK